MKARKIDIPEDQRDKFWGKYILAESTGMANDEVIEGDSNGGVA